MAKSASKKQVSSKSIKVGGTIMWAYLTKVNDLSEKYQFDLCQLSNKAVDALEEMDITVKYREDQPEKGKFITYKSARPIRAVDSDGDEITVPVGNGSKATVLTGTYSWEFKNKKGVSPTCKKLVVTDLTVFDAEDGDDDEDEAF